LHLNDASLEPNSISEGAGVTLQHVVLLRFPESLGEAGLVELRALFEPLAAEADFIRAMRLGRSTTEWTSGYEYLLYVELIAQSYLPAYLTHPRHVTIGTWIQEHQGTAVVFDYDIDAATVRAQPKDGSRP
jgi:hypothetical protein